MNTNHHEEEVRTGKTEPTLLFPEKTRLLLELLSFGGSHIEYRQGGRSSPGQLLCLASTYPAHILQMGGEFPTPKALSSDNSWFNHMKLPKFNDV